ncbi:biotin--[acetyl-CoA-carboxylase] ligase [Trujillonella endophytica]|uniref:biotin--[biotin carboxyl-carrier protein] ligase n=1 Tax=Trujillonella endophytica TaxID=673521 RepID=A0A1H8RTI6_9ACTN|nr:biotin--[acetyl-CoA-carboxylase] ligase [Trujillella endophytica]SEO69959.1 BirA family transcriptional regulator, biotin operon repressor / biotin-[acetyl-CoA-carboxylase] ligase [Trujillella endophytica]
MPDEPSPSPSDERWSDLERPALDGAALTAALARDGRLWRAVEVVERIGSTNAALVARAADGAPEGTVVVAEHQDAGRGRLDRVWTSPPRAGLTVSVLLRPDVPAARRGWLPLLTGVALAEAVAAVPGCRTALKWPNDLLAADGSKLAGILAEAVPAPDGPGAVVVGVGLNVSTRPDELPEGASSLAMEVGRTVDRAPVLLEFLRALERRYLGWTATLGDPVQSGLAHDYLAWCATVGTTVAVTLPDGGLLEGVAEAVDWDGRLVVRTPGGTVELASGDVRHVRGGSAPGG